MTAAEAVAASEFWTTNVAETLALGTTTNKEAGETLDGDHFDFDPRLNPGGREGWAVKAGRHIRRDDGEVVENPLYTMIAAEIERRRAA